ncbi:MAG: DUF4298 domain-containing protein [Bacteroidales bacterium]|nr:DUF4298 domain-containing protein [Bacteroidales bacterium]
MDKDLTERVLLMEDRYNEVMRVLAALDEAVAEYEDFKSELDVLKDYMESGQWKADFEADEAGRIPDKVSRGVLSEDGLYNLLDDADKIVAHAREVFALKNSEE